MLLWKFARFVISLWVALFLLAPAQASQTCEKLFDTRATLQPRGVDFGLRSDTTPLSTPKELLNFTAIKTDLWQTIGTLSKERQTEISHLLAAVEFFDYTHTADLILNNYLKNKGESFDFSKLYDLSDKENGAPFTSFLKARDNFLRKQQPEVSAELLANIHKYIMANGVEGVKKHELGVWRNAHWVGNSVGDFRMTTKEAEVVNANPYLTFEQKGTEPGSLRFALWRKISIWGREKDTRLETPNFELAEGVINYPHVKTPKESVIAIIKSSHPELYKKVMQFRKTQGLDAPVPAALEQSFTEALVQERFARFNQERAALGKIVIGKNESQYIDIVADLQRDLVAIHPLLNGNGRTTRLLMNYLLTKEGLPPVRLVDPFLDVQVSQKEWREYVHKGVVNSAQLQADIAFRIKNDFTVEYSPELLYPGLPESIGIALKKEGSEKLIENYAQTKVDSDQFGSFFKALVANYPELRQELKNDRLRTMSRIAELFVEYYRSKTVRYIHNKDGDLELGLRLVEPDFVNLFGVNHAGNKSEWDAKIQRWYDPNMLVWRGLSNKSYVPSKKELLDFFVNPTTHLASNSVFHSMNKGLSLVEAIKQDFLLYNREALNADLITMANDHHKSGPRYGESYGFSTSKREVVGKAFAMGAMVIAEYGKQNDPALQQKLKSRVNVAAYRAWKDVDLGRLRVFDNDFSYIYGRQAEVMGIGGTDPDAVMLLQRIDAEGKVFETYLRNSEKPNEILIIEGRYVPGEGPLPVDKIKERVTILPAYK